MTTKRLVVEEFELEKTTTYVYTKGYKWSCFKDPETGIYYRPKPNFEIVVEGFEDYFEEEVTEEN